MAEPQHAPGPVPEQSGELVAVTEPVRLPTPHGTFWVRAWAFADGSEHLTLTATAPAPEGPAAGEDGTAATGEQEQSPPVPWVRVHSECLTGDVFGSLRCDCGPQLHQGLELLQGTGGTLVYLRGHEGRGIGLVHKIRAYGLQEQGLDTVDANLALGFAPDQRRYEAAAAMLHGLGLTRIRLVTNNPAKAEALQELGIHVDSTEPDEVPPVPSNQFYLQTKRDRMRHLLRGLPPAPADGAPRPPETTETTETTKTTETTETEERS